MIKQGQTAGLAGRAEMRCPAKTHRSLDLRVEVEFSHRYLRFWLSQFPLYSCGGNATTRTRWYGEKIQRQYEPEVIASG